MKTFRLLAASLLIAVCAGFSSCSSEEEIPTLLEIDCQQAENFLSEGIIASPFQCYFEITVTANKSWTSTINYNGSQKDWCEYEPASMDMTSDRSMSAFTNGRLMIAQNTSGEERSATITITTGDISKSFTIKQKQNDVISLSTDLIKSNSNGGNYQIEVTSNIDYDVQIPVEHQDWVKFSNKTKTVSTNNIEFTIAPNLDYDKRECDIYIIPQNGTVTESLAPSLHILQLPKSLIELDKLQETFPKEGGNAIFLLTTNTEYEVVIDKTYSWIKLDKIENAQAKVQKLYISVSETETPRTGVVLIKDKNSDLIQELSIIQTNKSASKSVEVKTEGTLSSLIDESEKYQITSLTVSGRLNYSDIKFIADLVLKPAGGKGKITMLDLKNAKGLADGVSEAFNNTFIKKIILPQYTYTIDWNSFRNCTLLESIQIPAHVSYIGASAFSTCIYNHRTTKTNQKYPSVNL
ncbi:BACON domain-containing carbohydrate-binding protein [Bacteroides sp.]|uniref:BACON domain-containing protein n=1 Tax=Bacteroides sp. TaxID=29523 RepID=UPI001D6555AB|nr:BACON domain-containing carbohydrate-binding protein [Bacteroides sp.]MBS6967293.1 leucine-rich repeat protein [Bacteroides sp.]